LRAVGDEIERLGAKLVLIGNGTPEQGTEFEGRDPLPFRLLVDPDLVGYQALELKRSLLAGFRPRTLLHLVNALRAGYRGGRLEGDAYQLGGVFLIVPGGDVRYARVSRELGDEPPVEDVLESLAKWTTGMATATTG